MSKRRRRAKYHFNYNKNRKKLWLKYKRKNESRVYDCDELKKAWNKNLSGKYNLESLGLSFNPNATLGVPKYDLTPETADLANAIKLGRKCRKVLRPESSTVIQKLQEAAKLNRDKRLKIPTADALQLCYFVDKYGNDFEAMSRDKHNYYQLTARQIRKKIKVFMSTSFQYEEYLNAKAGGKDFSTVYD